MAEFNPYREWLGLEGVIGTPNYFVLLGVPREVQDAEEIRQAADRAIGRVRSQRPGANGQAWAGLIDRLNAAKGCLLDPGQRAEYEKQLAGPSAPRVPMAPPPGMSPAASYAYPPGMGGPAAGPSAPQPTPAAAPAMPYSPGPAPQPWQPTPAPMAQAPWPTAPAPAMPAAYPSYPDPNYPAAQPAMAMPMAAPAGWPAQPWNAAPTGYPPAATPWGAPPAAAPAATPYPWPAAAPYAARPAAAYPAAAPMAAPCGSGPAPMAMPAAMATAAPAAMPYDPFAGQQAYPPADMQYAAAPAPVEIPRGTAVAPAPAASPAMPPQEAPPADEPRGPEIKSREPTTTPVERKGDESNQVLIWGGAAAAVLLCAFLAIMSLPRDSGKPVAGPHHPSHPNHPTTPVSVKPGPVRPRPRPGPNDPKEPTEEPEEMVGPQEPKPPIPMRRPTETPNDPLMKPVTPEPPTPAPMPAPMPEPMPPKPAPMPMVAPPTPAELVELKQALSTAKQAMAERELDAAKQSLAKAEKVAKLPEHKAMVERLKKLDTHLNEFWSAVGDSLKELKATDELMIGSTVVAVVESGPDLLVARVAGGNRRYRKLALPHGLALNIADRWLDKSNPTTPVLRAAYLAADKGSEEEREQARQLFKDAKLDDLAQVLDDNYDKLASAGPAVGPMGEPLPKPTDPAMPGTASAADKAAVVKALTSARKALYERKTDVAKRELMRIHSTPKSPEHAAQVARLEKLAGHVDEFWKSLGDAMKQVKGGSDLMVKGKLISIVEVGPDLLVIRSEGQNQRFKRLEIPGAIVVALAETYFDMALPQNRLLLGSFYAVEPKKDTGAPDDALARGLWEDARRDIPEVADLLPVLEDKYVP